MKKTLALILSVLLCVGVFAGCASNQTPAPTTPATNGTPALTINVFMFGDIKIGLCAYKLGI